MKLDPKATSPMTANGQRVLRLTLKRRWFNMIACGDKKEEYRTPGSWILSRLEGKAYDRIEFKNGYGSNVPTMEVEYRGWSIDFGQLRWGAGDDKLVVIRLGRVLSLHNVKNQAREPQTNKHYANYQSNMEGRPSIDRPTPSTGQASLVAQRSSCRWRLPQGNAQVRAVSQSGADGRLPNHDWTRSEGFERQK